MLPKFQHFMPQHFLSRFAGLLAECKWPWLKSILIEYFINRYDINLTDALEPNPDAYQNFNDFFTRALKSESRPINQTLNSVISPVDGTLSEMGNIIQGKFIKAKGHNFSTETLLGGNKELAHLFEDGSFATIYLAPNDYHKVHMPIDGSLIKMIYIPGKLFSVNLITADAISDLFARNERLVSIFETSIGPVAQILVGAMLVGSIETPWAGTIKPNKHVIQVSDYPSPHLIKKGEEMGRFKLGSTVITLFPRSGIDWHTLQPGQKIKMGELLGTLNI